MQESVYEKKNYYYTQVVIFKYSVVLNVHIDVHVSNLLYFCNAYVTAA